MRAPSGHHARRRAFLLATPALIVIGLVGRFGLTGGLADAIGGAAYTAFAYLLLGIAFPDRSPTWLALAALGFSVEIELFQLTSVPQSMADAFSPSRLVFGTDFNAWDLPPYAIGALLAALVDRRLQATGA